MYIISFEQPTAAVSKSWYKMCPLCVSWRVFDESANPGRLLPDFERFLAVVFGNLDREAVTKFLLELDYNLGLPFYDSLTF